MHTLDKLERAIAAVEKLGYRVRQEWLGGSGGEEAAVAADVRSAVRSGSFSIWPKAPPSSSTSWLKCCAAKRRTVKLRGKASRNNWARFVSQRNTPELANGGWHVRERSEGRGESRLIRLVRISPTEIKVSCLPRFLMLPISVTPLLCGSLIAASIVLRRARVTQNPVTDTAPAPRCTSPPRGASDSGCSGPRRHGGGSRCSKGPPAAFRPGGGEFRPIALGETSGARSDREIPPHAALSRRETCGLAATTTGSANSQIAAGSRHVGRSASESAPIRKNNSRCGSARCSSRSVSTV